MPNKVLKPTRLCGGRLGMALGVKEKKERFVKASVYIATSLDGFIARKNGDIDWLGGSDENSGEDYGYKKFMETVDVLVMGRKTYEKALSFGEWPYGTKHVVVLSNSSPHIPDHISKTVETMSCAPTELFRQLSERGAKHAYIDGGKVIQSFLDSGLIHTLIITRIPVLIGTGIPLFGALLHDIKLQHIETRQFPTGLVQSEYEVPS